MLLFFIRDTAYCFYYTLRLYYGDTGSTRMYSASLMNSSTTTISVQWSYYHFKQHYFYKEHSA